MSSDDTVSPEHDAGQREIRKITDARTLRALTHPVRIALLETLMMDGAQTATEAGERIGETPTTCSFHLRQLAKYGFVEEAGGGPGRSRPWRLSTIGMSFAPASSDSDAKVASEAAMHLFRERQLARYEAWRAHRGSYPAAWQDASTDSQYLFYLTPGELEHLNGEVHDVLMRWFRLDGGRVTHADRRPAGSAPVEVLLFDYPIAPPDQNASPDQDTGADG
jgi:hypothetical protein